MAKKQEIPTKNYFIAIALIFAAIFITFYAFQLVKISKENRISESYLMKSKTILHQINLKESHAVLSETPEDYYIYISYTNDEDVYKLEKNLKPIINKYKLKEEFYYLNVTDIKDKDDYLSQINKALGVDVIKKVPTILYFKGDKLVSDGIVIREDDKMIEAGDFQNLLDKFEIEIK